MSWKALGRTPPPAGNTTSSFVMFAVVRNPYTRVVSEFKYRYRISRTRKNQNLQQPTADPLNRFVVNHLQLVLNSPRYSKVERQCPLYSTVRVHDDGGHGSPRQRAACTRLEHLATEWPCLVRRFGLPAAMAADNMTIANMSPPSTVVTAQDLNATNSPSTCQRVVRPRHCSVWMEGENLFCIHSGFTMSRTTDTSRAHTWQLAPVARTNENVSFTSEITQSTFCSLQKQRDLIVSNRCHILCKSSSSKYQNDIIRRIAVVVELPVVSSNSFHKLWEWLLELGGICLRMMEEEGRKMKKRENVRREPLGAPPGTVPAKFRPMRN